MTEKEVGDAYWILMSLLVKAVTRLKISRYISEISECRNALKCIDNKKLFCSLFVI